jgi:hypothetical protein
MFRGSVKSTGYLLHSPVFPSLPLPCVTVCHHISTGIYPVFPEGKATGRDDHPPHLAPRLKKEKSCTTTPPMSLRGLFWGDLYLYLYAVWNEVAVIVHFELHGPLQVLVN